MGRVNIDEAADDALFSVFDHSQGLQRRVFRIRARGFFNEHGVEEMKRQAEGLLEEIKRLAAIATPQTPGPDHG